MIQRRKTTQIIDEAIQITKGLDAFPKLEDDYKERSSTRGTVAMPCSSLGADVVDSTSKDILTEQSITMEDTWFEMSPKQRDHFNKVSNLYEEIRHDYHALHSMLWFSGHNYKFIDREIQPGYPHDACRIHGTFELNKVAGIFHIIFGKSVSFFGNHAHIINMFNNAKSNFSHRIDNFSFGYNSELVHNALNYELKITDNENTMYQYFVSVVSTEIADDSKKNTYQYSVTEKKRIIDHDEGSHGTAGIFFKYDISPIKVKVDLIRKSLLELIIPLIGIIGGIFSTSLMINSIFQSIRDFYKAVNVSN